MIACRVSGGDSDAGLVDMAGLRVTLVGRWDGIVGIQD
jgi:hypothetical protein